MLYLEVNCRIKNFPKYQVYLQEYKKPIQYILTAESEEELSLKMAIAGLEVEKCLTYPGDILHNNSKWARYSVYKIGERT